jgi:uncharacterized protein YbjT (DUF2867 family)
MNGTPTMKITVIGATGMIGSRIVAEAVQLEKPAHTGTRFTVAN